LTHSSEAKTVVYRGHVEKGVIHLEESAVLPEGAEVRVEIASPPGGYPTEKQDFSSATSPVEDELSAIWADVPESQWTRLPADLTDNLDHYVYGTPE
jgi:hypothetical protein